MISQVPQCQVGFLTSDIICLRVKSSQIVSMTFNALVKGRHICPENDASHLFSTLLYSIFLP